MCLLLSQQAMQVHSMFIWSAEKFYKTKFRNPRFHSFRDINSNNNLLSKFPPKMSREIQNLSVIILYFPSKVCTIFFIHENLVQLHLMARAVYKNV